MRHHYVPQFLLRSWAGTTADGRVETFRLDLPNLPVSRHAPKHTAYEHDLYALTMDEVAGMSKQAVETHCLRLIDEAAAQVLTKLLSKGLKNLSHEERCDWARFIMSLRLRQPEVVQRWKLEASATLQSQLAQSPEEYQALAQEDDPATLSEYVEQLYPGLIDNFGLSTFSKHMDDARIRNKLLCLTWWLWDFSESKYDLMLADHPCIFTAKIDNPRLILALPIAPRKAFLATASDEVVAIMRGQDQTTLAVRLNESSVGQARVRVYARDALPRRFIGNRLRFRSPSS